MDSNSQQSGGSPPAKPWERAGGSSSGPTPFKPPTPGSTSDVVEASGTALPGEIVSSANRNTAMASNTLGRPVPARPWEQQQTYGSTAYGGGYGTGLNYNSGYGSSMLGSSSYGGLGGSYGGALGGSYGGALGGSYGGGMYGNSMYRGGYGGSMYGGGMYGGAGGSMYGGSPMGGGYGMGVGPYGEQDPNNPYGAPPSPPGFWMSFLRVMQGVVNFFGRISILIDQNTQAFHLFMTAMLQLFDRSGVLYGELARFVLRVLGIRTKPRKVEGPGPNGLPAPHNPHGNHRFIEAPKGAPASGPAWDNVWGES